MIHVKWEYFPDNICTDRPVAILKKEPTNTTILYVYEARDQHFCRPTTAYSFLNLQPISYHKEARAVRHLYDETSLSTHELLTLRLKEGCKLIESDFLCQSSKIVELLT